MSSGWIQRFGERNDTIRSRSIEEVQRARKENDKKYVNLMKDLRFIRFYCLASEDLSYRGDGYLLMHNGRNYCIKLGIFICNNFGPY